MTESAHHTFRHGGHRVGLAGALLGIAALSGAGPFPRTAPSAITAIFT
jgi:hypothetical protein